MSEAEAAVDTVASVGQYPPSNAGLGVDRQPALPMQRVSSGPISVVGNDVVDGMAGLRGYHPVTHARETPSCWACRFTLIKFIALIIIFTCYESN